LAADNEPAIALWDYSSNGAKHARTTPFHMSARHEVIIGAWYCVSYPDMVSWPVPTGIVYASAMLEDARRSFERNDAAHKDVDSGTQAIRLAPLHARGTAVRLSTLRRGRHLHLSDEIYETRLREMKRERIVPPAA
jgi:hypothetical protein